MGKYSVRGWQYWPDRREGQYRTRELNISPYCTTQKECNNIFIIMTVLRVGKEKRRVRGEKKKRERKEKKTVNTGIRTQDASSHRART